ncbi:Zn-ribbon domain-containing OB-fold protein [Actinomadura madurae]|uniref:Zn-ribbon domain-containing OB-fold protein n=1 Tax=Actinomadura madurae TaxID=1993 RepID=UPI0020D207EE|nr:zinc ribbon domain-containing protein [Actinomadura madurae]MCP9955383.1 zinc ribbon domain-containing protein [Actinomadura madurae]MCP9984624.1 zinc ribbon domain-containing protein [Actinomadura madurae]
MSEATEPLPGNAKPLPDVDDPLTAPFWAAAREARLVLPRCTHCSYLQWPPEPVCPECRHTGRAWHEFPRPGEAVELRRLPPGARPRLRR